ncbi:pumilio 23 [Artemisia annua]|uniref:Pumilio 23 n=1 Tax=Artemisia annua TaxID=35608 RepID=A0A2U1L6I1_ARTAN|nr:pumilio 23 [Artemisia annua]
MDATHFLSLLTSGDSYSDKEGNLWMITGRRSTLVQRLRKELANAQTSRKIVAASLRMVMQKAAQIRLMEKEKNKSPSFGSYVCAEQPGEFRWQPGSLTQAITVNATLKCGSKRAIYDGFAMFDRYFDAKDCESDDFTDKRAKNCDLLAECDMVRKGDGYSRGGDRRNMSRKSMKKSKGGESGGAAGDSYRQDGYSEYQDGSAAPHTSFLRKEQNTSQKFSNVIEGAENMEERSSICGNALEETRRKENRSKDFPRISMDKSGSHVAETALKSFAAHLQEGGDQSLIEAIVANPVEVMTNCHGSHVLRSLLCLCKGVPLDSSDFHSKKSSAVLAQQLNLKPSWSDGSGFHGTQMGFPDMLKFLAAKGISQTAMLPKNFWVKEAAFSHLMEVILEPVNSKGTWVKIKDLFGMGKGGGVLASLLAACEKLHSHEQKCCQALTGPVSVETKPPRCIVPRILFLDTYFYCKDKSNWDWPSGARMHTMGTVIPQLVFKFPSRSVLQIKASEYSSACGALCGSGSFLDNASFKMKMKIQVRTKEELDSQQYRFKPRAFDLKMSLKWTLQPLKVQMKLFQSGRSWLLRKLKHQLKR